MQRKFFLLVGGVVLSLLLTLSCSLNLQEDSNLKLSSTPDPKDVSQALDMAITFFQFNYCGSGQTASWRSNCHMQDNPVGGYHDAGDHVKFNLPAAFSADMLLWAAYEYGLPSSVNVHVKRFIDYFKACGTSGNIIYQVGDPGADHAYWGPPELQTGSRPSYSGRNISCVLANEAAVFALSYITGIGGGDITTAKNLYALAESAKSDADYTAANGYYNSWSGFYDELVWAAIWIYLADTNANKEYLSKAETYFANLNTSDYKWTQCWDDKKYGAILKLAQITGKKVYVEWVEKYLDYWMKGGGISYTPGGLPYLDSWGVLRYASATAFLAKIWADYTNVGTASKKATYKNFANSVVNYILGSNPANISYVIGYGSRWPQQPHHRAANPNKGVAKYTLTGALVGGPNSSDQYIDDVNQYQYQRLLLITMQVWWEPWLQ